MEKKDWKQGLSNGHIAQIVRRKNVVRVVSSKKTYSRRLKRTAVFFAISLIIVKIQNKR